MEGTRNSVVSKKEGSLSSLILLEKNTANNNHFVTIIVSTMKGYNLRSLSESKKICAKPGVGGKLKQLEGNLRRVGACMCEEKTK